LETSTREGVLVWANLGRAIVTNGGNKFYYFPQTQLIKYGATMSFAFKEELNELVIFRHCCSAANLWVLTLSCLSFVNY